MKTEITLNDQLGSFIQHEIEAGKYASTNEVIQSALELLQETERQKAALNFALEEGEKSGFVEDFNPTEFLKSIRKKAGLDD